jgi:hypothetical protein
MMLWYQILFSGTNASEAKSSFGSFLLKDNNIFKKLCSLLSPTRRMIKRLPAMAATTRNTLAQLLKVLYLSENQLLFNKNDRLLFLVWVFSNRVLCTRIHGSTRTD